MIRLAYIMGTFPALTETFVAGEIEALGAAGVEIALFSLRRPSGRHDHAQAEGAGLAGRTCYGSSLRGQDLWAANVRALCRAPARYLHTVGAVVAHTILNPVHCLKSLALFPVAVAFAERMREERITHVHAHWANYPATAAYIVSRLLSVPYSFTAHAHDATLIRAMIRAKIRRATFVMTCTGWTRDWLCRLVPEARAKIFLNYHGVVPDRFGPARTTRSVNPAIFTIVSCGSLYPRKGFPYLLEACRLLRDRGWLLDCLIVGEGPMRGELQRFIDRHRLGERVRLVGAVAPREVVHYYRQADLFVLACMTDYLGWRELFTDRLLLLEVGPAIPFRPLTDGIPNVLVEAMAAEVPVVSTHVAGIPELIQDDRTGRLVPERNADALAAAIEELLGDPEKRRALARAGRAAVLDRFDRLRNIHQLVRIFGEHGPREATVPTGAPAPFARRDEPNASSAVRPSLMSPQYARRQALREETP
jgi:glycosyltransferase involved in cell wall biosynthesis